VAGVPGVIVTLEHKVVEPALKVTVPVGRAGVAPAGDTGAMVAVNVTC
jgi:hypothetical protein